MQNSPLHSTEQFYGLIQHLQGKPSRKVNAQMHHSQMPKFRWLYPGAKGYFKCYNQFTIKPWTNVATEQENIRNNRNHAFIRCVSAGNFSTVSATNKTEQETKATIKTAAATSISAVDVHRDTLQGSLPKRIKSSHISTLWNKRVMRTVSESILCPVWDQ